MRCQLCGNEATLTVWKADKLLNCCEECLAEAREAAKAVGKESPLRVSCVWKQDGLTKAERSPEDEN